MKFWNPWKFNDSSFILNDNVYMNYTSPEINGEEVADVENTQMSAHHFDIFGEKSRWNST